MTDFNWTPKPWANETLRSLPKSITIQRLQAIDNAIAALSGTYSGFDWSGTEQVMATDPLTPDELNRLEAGFAGAAVAINSKLDIVVAQNTYRTEQQVEQQITAGGFQNQQQVNDLIAASITPFKNEEEIGTIAQGLIDNAQLNQGGGTMIDVTDFLRRDGTLTLTGNLLPDSGNSSDLGSSGSYYRDIFGGTVHAGVITHRAANTIMQIGTLNEDVAPIGNWNFSGAAVSNIPYSALTNPPNIPALPAGIVTDARLAALDRGIFPTGASGAYDLGVSSLRFGTGYFHDLQTRSINGIDITSVTAFGGGGGVSDLDTLSDTTVIGWENIDQGDIGSAFTVTPGSGKPRTFDVVSPGTSKRPDNIYTKFLIAQVIEGAPWSGNPATTRIVMEATRLQFSPHGNVTSLNVDWTNTLHEGSIVPSVNNTMDLGDSLRKLKDIYAFTARVRNLGTYDDANPVLNFVGQFQFATGAQVDMNAAGDSPNVTFTNAPWAGSDHTHEGVGGQEIDLNNLPAIQPAGDRAQLLGSQDREWLEVHGVDFIGHSFGANGSGTAQFGGDSNTTRVRGATVSLTNVTELSGAAVTAITDRIQTLEGAEVDTTNFYLKNQDLVPVGTDRNVGTSAGKFQGGRFSGSVYALSVLPDVAAGSFIGGTSAATRWNASYITTMHATTLSAISGTVTVNNAIMSGSMQINTNVTASSTPNIGNDTDAGRLGSVYAGELVADTVKPRTTGTSNVGESGSRYDNVWTDRLRVGQISPHTTQIQFGLAADTSSEILSINATHATERTHMHLSGFQWHGIMDPTPTEGTGGWFQIGRLVDNTTNRPVREAFIRKLAVITDNSDLLHDADFDSDVTYPAGTLLVNSIEPVVRRGTGLRGTLQIGVDMSENRGVNARRQVWKGWWNIQDWGIRVGAADTTSSTIWFDTTGSLSGAIKFLEGTTINWDNVGNEGAVPWQAAGSGVQWGQIPESMVPTGTTSDVGSSGSRWRRVYTGSVRGGGTQALFIGDGQTGDVTIGQSGTGQSVSIVGPTTMSGTTTFSGPTSGIDYDHISDTPTIPTAATLFPNVGGTHIQSGSGSTDLTLGGSQTQSVVVNDNMTVEGVATFNGGADFAANQTVDFTDATITGLSYNSLIDQPSGTGTGGDEWGTPVDANITFDTDNTYSIGTTAAAAQKIHTREIVRSETNRTLPVTFASYVRPLPNTDINFGATGNRFNQFYTKNLDIDETLSFFGTSAGIDWTNYTNKGGTEPWSGSIFNAASIGADVLSGSGGSWDLGASGDYWAESYVTTTHTRAVQSGGTNVDLDIGEATQNVLISAPLRVKTSIQGESSSHDLVIGGSNTQAVDFQSDVDFTGVEVTGLTGGGSFDIGAIGSTAIQTGDTTEAVTVGGTNSGGVTLVAGNGDTQLSLSNFATIIHEDLRPAANNSQDLGSNSLAWNTVYAKEVRVGNTGEQTLKIQDVGNGDVEIGQGILSNHGVIKIKGHVEPFSAQTGTTGVNIGSATGNLRFNEVFARRLTTGAAATTLILGGNETSIEVQSNLIPRNNEDLGTAVRPWTNIYTRDIQSGTSNGALDIGTSATGDITIGRSATDLSIDSERVNVTGSIESGATDADVKLGGSATRDIVAASDIKGDSAGIDLDLENINLENSQVMVWSLQPTAVLSGGTHDMTSVGDWEDDWDDATEQGAKVVTVATAGDYTKGSIRYFSRAAGSERYWAEETVEFSLHDIANLEGVATRLEGTRPVDANGISLANHNPQNIRFVWDIRGNQFRVQENIGIGNRFEIWLEK